MTSALDRPAALDRFLTALEARDASPNTRRAYATAVGAYLAWLDGRGIDWRAPDRVELRSYLATLSDGHARSSVAQRLAALRSFYRFATRAGLAAGDPWGSLATPRLPRRLPRVLEVEQVERLLAAVDDEVGDEAGDQGQVDGLPRTAGRELRAALALRDRAIVETAYAAGLRIGELATATAADLDLRRGELRVMGKGRKERIGLLGRPARAALADYLANGRPTLLARRRGHSPSHVAPVEDEPRELFLNHLGTALGARGLR